MPTCPISSSILTFESLARLPLHPSKEVDISEFLHLVNVHRLDNFLVVEKDPRPLVPFVGDLLANESHVVPTGQNVSNE